MQGTNQGGGGSCEFVPLSPVIHGLYTYQRQLLHKETGFLWAPSFDKANRHHNHHAFTFSPGRSQTHSSPPASAFQVLRLEV